MSDAGVQENGLRRKNSRVVSTRNLLQTAEDRARQKQEFASIESELKLLIDSGVDVNAKVGTSGNTPLVLAAFAGLDELVRQLIDLGADVNGTIESGYSPLVVAARGNHQKVGEILIKAEADVKQESNTGSFPQPLNQSGPGENNHRAFRFEEFYKGAWESEVGYDVAGLSALWWASYRGNGKLVKQLLDAGAEPTSTSKSGATALLMATQEGHVEVVRLLVDAGADADAASKKGSSPLLIAVQYNKQNKENHVEICKLLLDGGANPNTLKPGSQQTVLWIAAYMSDPETTALLVEAKADVDREADDGSTPLYVATIKNCVGCMEELLEGGAEVDPTYSSTNWTPLHAASALGHKRATQLLLESGANKNLRDAKKRRPIDVIGIEGRDLSPAKREEIKKLLDDGLKVEIEEATDVTKPSRTVDPEDSSLSPDTIIVTEEVKEDTPKKDEKPQDKKPPAKDEKESKPTEGKKEPEKPEPEKQSKPAQQKKEPEEEKVDETEPKVTEKEKKPDPKKAEKKDNEGEEKPETKDEPKEAAPEEKKAAPEPKEAASEEKETAVKETVEEQAAAPAESPETSNEIGFMSAAPVVGESESLSDGFLSAPAVVGFSTNNKEEGTTRGAGFPMWTVWVVIALVVGLCLCLVCVLLCRRRTRRSSPEDELGHALSAPFSSSPTSGATSEQDVEGGQGKGGGSSDASINENGEHSNPVFGRGLSSGANSSEQV
ncbi:hypothetical protein BSKO_11363 [Bryopsis sp. KO-2023]|nr:hypothetical protein BSKO_11363 [Bryopsis sp. KO-2023]